MYKLNEKEERLLRSLVALSQDQMQAALYEYLQKKYTKVVQTPSYLYAVGDIPIALVAHMDTVFSTQPSDVYYDREHGVMWSPQGLGADDRAGIFIILSLLRNTKLRPSIIFTRDEEKGALGAEQLVTDLEEPLSALNYVIQLDRRGTNDCVFYSCDNQEFISYVEQFGFSENFGSFSDISEICPAWKIAGTNLSVGYQNEHSYTETLHIAPMIATYNKVKQMLKEETIPFFKYIPAKRLSLPYMGNSTLHKSNMFHFCNKCHTMCSDEESIPAIGLTGKKVYYCFSCCVDGINWCSKCGQAFETKDADDSICVNCRKEPAISNV